MIFKEKLLYSLYLLHGWVYDTKGVGDLIQISKFYV